MVYETDCLRIVKMGRKCGKHLRSLLEKENPHLMFLPGGNPELDILAHSSYKYLLDPAYKEPILLYDSTRVKIDHLISSSSCEFDNVLTPLVNIYSPAPAQNIVKQFVCVTWHWKLTEAGGSRDLYENGRSYMMLAQSLAYFTGKEVLFGGDFNLPMSKIDELIKEHNQLVQQGIDRIKPEFQKLGYMDCMTETINRPQRRLRQLKLHKSNSVTDENFFVASKEMQLFKTSHETVENLNYHSTGLQLPSNVETNHPARLTHNKTETESNFRKELLRTMANVNIGSCPKPPSATAKGNTASCPQSTYTRTQMYMPQRPPKHHGG